MSAEAKGGVSAPMALAAKEDAVGTRYTIRGLFGFVFYSHLNPLFRLGSQRPLVQSDLGTIPPSASSTATMPDWEKYWAEELKLPESQRSLMRPMRRTLGSTKIVFASIITIVGAGAPFANPLILKALTKYHLGLLDLTLVQKWILVALTLFIPIVTQLTTGYAQGSYNIMSVRIRNMLSYVVYQKLLVLRSTQVESGNILNMLNSDMRQIEMLFELLPALIIVPGLFSVSIWLIYIEVGVSIFAGFGYQVCTLPFIVAVMITVTSFFQAKQKLTDKRLKLVNEILNGIRVVKNYVWEEAFKTLIEDVRDKEIAMTKHVGLLFSCAEATVRSSSIMLPVIIFYTYMRLGNALTIDKTFVVISYIGILASSVSALPNVLQYFFQASVAMGRILTLLNEKPMDVYVNTSAADEGVAICFRNANLSWNKDAESTPIQATSSSLEKLQSEPARAAAGVVQTKSVDQKEYELVPLPAPNSAILDETTSKEDENIKTDKESNRALHTLIDISFSVKKGQLVAIVGGVGCGKSSCLVSLLNELELTSGSVSVAGTIAYHSQSSWIMNASIQENIIFGAPYDEQRFAKVIKQACLETDLTLMPSGVNTEIGEKGINLSGGQKARISFARTLYRSSNILLFDDPLSAVDAHVGTQMFASMKEQCSAEGGGRTVVLVTHQVQFLSECDQIVLLEDGRIKMAGTYQECQAQGINIESIVTSTTQKAEDENSDDEENEEEETEHAHDSITELESSELKQDGNPLVARTSRENSRTRAISSSSSHREGRTSSLSSSSKKSSRSRTISSEKKKTENLPSTVLMTEEEKGVGSVSFDVYSWFIERFTFTIFFIMIFTYLGGSISQASSTYLLTDWSNAIIASYMSTGAPLSLDDNLLWIGTYAWRNAIMVFSVFVATLM